MKIRKQICLVTYPYSLVCKHLTDDIINDLNFNISVQKQHNVKGKTLDVKKALSKIEMDRVNSSRGGGGRDGGGRDGGMGMGRGGGRGNDYNNGGGGNNWGNNRSNNGNNWNNGGGFGGGEVNAIKPKSKFNSKLSSNLFHLNDL